MKAATAVFAGVCFAAVAALAQPKVPSPQGPIAAKVPSSGEKAFVMASPIEGFALDNIHTFEVGELKASCGVDAKRRELTMRAMMLPSKPGTYGGCCYEHTEARPVDLGTTVAASLSLTRSEPMVHVAVEQSSGMEKRYLHRGRLDAGTHELVATNVNLTEVRRVCVEVFADRATEPHETSLRIKRVKFNAEATVKPSLARSGAPVSR